MSWAIEFERSATREFRKLDKATQLRIREYFNNRVLAADGPRALGKPLRGRQSDLWRYRVGHHRIVCEIQDSRLVVLIVRVGHRGQVYRPHT